MVTKISTYLTFEKLNPKLFEGVIDVFPLSTKLDANKTRIKLIAYKLEKNQLIDKKSIAIEVNTESVQNKPHDNRDFT